MSLWCPNAEHPWNGKCVKYRRLAAWQMKLRILPVTIHSQVDSRLLHNLAWMIITYFSHMIYPHIVSHLGNNINIIMSAMVSQITGFTIVYLNVCSDADQRKHQSPSPWPLGGKFTGDWWIPHTKGPFDDIIMILYTFSMPSQTIIQFSFRSCLNI